MCCSAECQSVEKWIFPDCGRAEKKAFRILQDQENPENPIQSIIYTYSTPVFSISEILLRILFRQKTKKKNWYLVYVLVCEQPVKAMQSCRQNAGSRAIQIRKNKSKPHRPLKNSKARWRLVRIAGGLLAWMLMKAMLLLRVTAPRQRITSPSLQPNHRAGTFSSVLPNTVGRILWVITGEI
jgi:hypothetical protein